MSGFLKSKPTPERTFLSECERRHEEGKRVYQDRSYHRPLRELLSEIQEEHVDVFNWSAIADEVAERDEAPGATSLRGELLAMSEMSALWWRRLEQLKASLPQEVPDGKEERQTRARE